MGDNSATEVRDLRTGEPVWRSYPSWVPDAHPLIAGVEVDVLVLGAGVSGALVAEAATAKGLSVAVIDRRAPAGGSTAASTALIQFELDTPLVRLVDEMGMQRAGRVWRRSFQAVQDLGTLVQRTGIPCDFAPQNAVYLAGNVLDPGELMRECEMRQSIGLPTKYLNRSDLRGLASIDREAALYSSGAAELNPVQLTGGLLQHAMLRGAQLYAPVNIAEVHPGSSSVALATSEGVEFVGRALVFATGYELADGIPRQGHKRTSTWAFATKPQPEALWPNRELIWEASDPYLYIRATADGRLMVGGEDEDIDDEQRRDALLAIKVEALQTKAKALFPALDVGAAFSWTGTFGESENGMPTIGAVPGMPNCYGVLGYGGNGITFAAMAAQMLVSELLGVSDPDRELFAFA